MKTFAHLNASGVVQAIVTLDAPDAIRAGLQAEPDQVIIEVDSAELTSAGNDVEKVREILKDYRIAQPSPQRATMTRV